MKKSLFLAVALVALAAAPAFAASAKTYQVTGPVVEMSADTITVQKGSEKWEIARGTAGLPADVKVGSKVTVQYSMTAESVVAKPAASPLASSAAPSAAASSKAPSLPSASASSSATTTATAPAPALGASVMSPAVAPASK